MSEPNKESDELLGALSRIIYYIDEGGSDAICTIERVARAAIANARTTNPATASSATVTAQ